MISDCRTGHFDASGPSFEIVTYDEKEGSLAGLSAMDIASGMFTCSVKGAYKFDFGAAKVCLSISKCAKSAHQNNCSHQIWVNSIGKFLTLFKY